MNALSVEYSSDISRSWCSTEHALENATLGFPLVFFRLYNLKANTHTREILHIV